MTNFDATTAIVRAPIHLDDSLDATVLAHALGHGLKHKRYASWSTGVVDLRLPGEPFASEIGEDEGAALAARMRDGALLQVRIHRGRLSAVAYASTAERAAVLIDDLRRRFGPPAAASGATVNVTFWHFGRGVPTPVDRTIAAQSWASIERNYHSRTREQLAGLMGMRPLAAGGKLVLWHGVPGTGKTWALRALIREWSTWAQPHYVVDPDAFLGSPSYMLGMILDGEDEPEESDSDATPWRLMIMEDTGELLSRDAKYELGQGLSRLLNVCDGLIGQGLRLLVLITSNEEIGVMHPAVTRAGKCVANIHFSPLNRDEIELWGERNGRAFASRSGLLADLYEGGSAPQQPTQIGFRP